MASDLIGSRSTLEEIFGEETVLVNIAKETTKDTIAQRVREWCGQNERNVYIGRGSQFGNPYSHLDNTAAEFQVATREDAIEKYRAYIFSRPDLLEKLKELKGKRLGCWCVSKNLQNHYVCHGQVLLELLYTS
jgi:FMN phosphatase YigB (HAD superfamily)